MGGESEESETPGVAEPTGTVTFDENLDEIMDAPIDKPTVPAYPTRSSHHCTYTTQR